MKKILITGADGQLGRELRGLSSSYDYDCVFASRREIDISDTLFLRRHLEELNVDVIINCAAYTNVNKAESEKDAAMKINSEAVGLMAQLTSKMNITLVQISTDYIFDGNKNTPYGEDDEPIPISVYGYSKYEGEKAIIANTKDYIIIRTSWLYSDHGHNFMNTIIRLASEKRDIKVVYDQIGTPTYAYDLAKAILDVMPKIGSGTSGVYNFSNEGVASWYDFAVAITDYAGLDVHVEPIETDLYPVPAKRPAYSLLSKDKIKRVFDLRINHWSHSLYNCIEGIR